MAVDNLRPANRFYLDVVFSSYRKTPSLWQTLFMPVVEEQELLMGAFKLLGDLLPDGDMELTQQAMPEGTADSGRDAIWEIRAVNYHCQLLVQAFARFIPRDVDRVLGGNHPLMRRVVRDPIVVVAPWLSPRSRELLRERGFNYLDLTGNVLVRIPRPSLYLRLDGAQQDPNPPAKRPVLLRGAGVNALVRTLVDFAPPYKLVDLAAASRLSNGYVSRALEALADDRLISRDTKTKSVIDVDWMQLLVTRAENYSLFKSNRSRTYLARGGPNALLRALGKANDEQAVVTGSFAAQQYVRVTAPTQLALYVSAFEEFAQRYDLMPAAQGANVVLLIAADESQLTRGQMLADGTFHVGLSQLVQDCLAGNGRLPEEGIALLDWMTEHPAAWRQPHLPPRG